MPRNPANPRLDPYGSVKASVWDDSKSEEENMRAYRNEIARRWRAKHPEQSKKYRQGHHQKMARNRGETMSEYNRRNSLKKYGITPEQYDRLLELQDGKCAICRKERLDGGKNFHIDHDHSCCSGLMTCGRCIRGILCSKCNAGIGMFSDNPDTIEAAVSYLRRGGAVWPMD